MDVALINPFINATIKVLATMAQAEVQAGKPYLKKDNIAKGDVSGLIGITGETNGTIAVTFDSGSILKIVSSMFGEDITELNNEVADAVGELTNMISGQARRKLEEDGKLFEAAIPSVVTGANHEITHITEGPIIAIPFHTEAGNFTIEICLES